MLIQTREQFVAARTTLLQAPVIAVDTETTGLNWDKGDRIIGISMCCNLPGNEMYRLACYFPFRHSPKSLNLFTVSENLPLEWMQELKPVFTRSDVTLVFHNFKFDAKMLRSDGIEVTSKVYDTMLMSHLIDENGVHSLKGLAAEKWGDEVREDEKRTKKLVQKLGGWEKTSAAEMEPYASLDAEMTFDLWHDFLEELENQELMQLYETQEAPFLRCLLEMEWEGIEIDLVLAEHKSSQARQRMRELEDELGFDPGKRALLARKLFGAPPEGLGFPLPTDPDSLNQPTSEFPGGEPKMDEMVLSQMDHPIPQKVLEYRGLVKANSTWWMGYQKKADLAGRIHPQYATGDKKEKFGTVTGRLSSSNPNVQQMPRDPNTPVKKLLLPPEGFSMFEFDYSQIELRLAACYGNDELYLESMKAGEDPHQATADAAGVTRQAAKHASYCIIYGGSYKTLKATFERLEYQETGEIIVFPEWQAKDILDNYYRVHPNLKAVAKKAEAVARSRGWVRLWTGRRRHFRSDEPWHHRKAFNSIIQGGAADLVKGTMLRFHEMRDVQPFRMVTQVHDSLWFEVPIDGEAEHLELITKTMEWPGDEFPIPFPVDIKRMRNRDPIPLD